MNNGTLSSGLEHVSFAASAKQPPDDVRTTQSTVVIEGRCVLTVAVSTTRNVQRKQGLVMTFRRITENDEIRSTMNSYMLTPDQQRAPFLATIFTREHRPGGMIYEGTRPLSASTDAVGETTYSLTNSDSGYSRPIAHIKLSGVEYVEVLC